LDDFTAPSAAAAPTNASASTSTSAQPSQDIASFDDEFTKQLAAEMEKLMVGFGGDISGDLKSTMDQLLSTVKMAEQDATVGGTASTEATTAPAASLPTSSSSTSTPAAPAAGAGSFQSKISETMNKLRDSSDKVEVGCPPSTAIWIITCLP
jgi:hypothetical protein